MSIKSAQKYINDLHKKQQDPSQWPDFLTGLPDRYAVLRSIDDAYSHLDKKFISFLRIANIHPYLLKYGNERHIQVIEWGAAILKVTADKYGFFVGAYDTHDFVVIGDKNKMDDFIADVSGQFDKKSLSFYDKDDVSRPNFLSFKRDGKQVNIGYMKFISASINKISSLPKAQVILYLSSMCAEAEGLMPFE